jgi:hypothetical protein
MPETAHQTYARVLRWHSFGHALYHPVPAADLRPGSVGFFDENGRWCKLIPTGQWVDFPDIIPGPGDIKSELGVFTSEADRDYKLGADVTIESARLVHVVDNLVG